MSVKETIEAKLSAALTPVQLDVVDDSESHRGHGGWREGGETHFNLLIVADAFVDKTRVARQRLVLDALAEEMTGAIHALSMRCHTPEEAKDLDI